MRIKTFLLLVAIVAVSAFAVTAQQQVWTENNQDRSNIVTDKAVARLSFPREFKLFNLDIAPLRQQLFSIVGDNARGQSTIISLPNANGSLEYFEVFEASNFEPELQARFPEIRAFSGRGVTDKYASLKLSISPQGIQTMIFRTDTQNEFIEAYSEDHNVYAVYNTNRQKGNLPWACTTEEQQMFSVLNSSIPADAPSSNTGQLKTMRLAQSVNAEYSNFFGATNSSQVALVLAAVNATLTRTNGVYERDLAIHLNLIANTTAVFYYDPATDPYTTLPNWNNQLQATLTSVIGEANYDIGHLFGASGGGGNAGCIGCVCVDGQKGRGITSPADAIPQGDNFDIDYVAHEVGHQMGANHTFSFQLETGTGQNKEVGSGITVMGYAGITGQDVAPHSIDTFHATSIQQIQVNMAPKPCPVNVNMTANAPPVVAPVSNFTIPITTPFALTGSATDPQGDPLTYQWEQNDVAVTGNTGANSVASPTKVTGPNWLTFPSTSSPTRMFPRLSTILAGQAVTGPLPGGDAGANIEALSSVARTLNFRLTVRDNRPYVAGSTIGQTQFTDTVITVSAAGGPFRVTSANTAATIVSGNNYNVTWDVNNTNAAPFNAANVKISFSSDGGQTFPTVLAASTANDGSETIVVPAVQTTQGRIKIEAIGNIFFDINDANITVNQPGGPAIINAGSVAITAESCGGGNGSPDPGETVTVSLPLSNDGGSATNNLTATLQATGGVSSAVAQSYGAIAPGATTTRSFTFTVSNTVTCGSNVTLTFLVADGATNYANVTKVYQTGTAVVSLSQDFNGVTAPALPAGWTNTQLSGTAINWVSSTTNPSSAPNAAFANDPATVNLAALTSPPVVVQSATARIKFKNRFTTEDTYDGMVLEYSTNNGTTWTDVITGGGTFVTGGYTDTLNTGFMNPLPGRQAWSGNSNGYIDTEVTLPASLNGQTVRFRWLMGSDSSVAATGVWVDNVEVLGGVICACGPGQCQQQRRFDYDGDNKSDVSVYRPGATGAWYLLNSGSAAASYGFGTTGDKIVPADYDGDGKTDVAVYRSGTWYLLRSTAGFTGVSFGEATDIPQPADITGDGKAELVVFRPSNGGWYTYNLVNGATSSAAFGTNGDRPVIGDYDGDCKADFAVFRPGAAAAWYVLKSTGGFSGFGFGTTGDVAVPADYDGDGKTDYAVFRSGFWYVQGSTAGFSGSEFGFSSDLPIPADYDGDGKADRAVFRNGTWYLLRTTAGFTGVGFGNPTDIPTPYAFIQ
jgi:hypothetical protein